eukprot:10068026-Karenia_brevis.AAC.1
MHHTVDVHTKNVLKGQCRPWLAARDPDHLTESHHGFHQSLFVTRPTVVHLVTKRSSRTSSSVLPWAALRAAVKYGHGHID